MPELRTMCIWDCVYVCDKWMYECVYMYIGVCMCNFLKITELFLKVWRQALMGSCHCEKWRCWQWAEVLSKMFSLYVDSPEPQGQDAGKPVGVAFGHWKTGEEGCSAPNLPDFQSMWQPQNSSPPQLCNSVVFSFPWVVLSLPSFAHFHHSQS